MPAQASTPALMSSGLVGAAWDARCEMTRHTTFKFCLNPDVHVLQLLDRHAGASRFAFNQCLRMVKSALAARRIDPTIGLSWTGFDLIKAFNGWKKTEAAGRIFAVDSAGVAEVRVTGLAWRNRVCQQVFEEAAVDCGRALSAWSDSRRRKRKGRPIGFPRFKKKTRDTPAFRLRNKYSKGGRPAIRIGETHPRSVTLPGVGSLRVRDDTRRLRRLLAKGRARILFATVSHHGGRWWVALNVEAADLHIAHRHRPREAGDRSGWIGIDRGLAVFAVAATANGCEVARFDGAPKPRAGGMRQQRRLSKLLSRKQKGSHNRRRVAARPARHHQHVANIRRHFLHKVSNELVKTHDRLILEALNVAGMLRNHSLAALITDAGWAAFATQVHYKQTWRGGEIATADRWYPSSKRCAACGLINPDLPLNERVFGCSCGYSADRDLNAAVNLAQWAQNHHSDPRTPKRGGRVNNARRRDGADQHPGVGETSPNDAGTDVQAAPAA